MVTLADKFVCLFVYVIKLMRTHAANTEECALAEDDLQT